MPSRRSGKARVLATQAIDLGFAIPQVVAHRAMRMARAGSSPTLRDREEFYLMSAEKVAAFYESWTAMAIEMYRVTLQLSLSAMPGFWFRWPVTTRSSRAAQDQWQRSFFAVLGKGVAPIHRRAVANAKRLARRR